MSTSRAAQVESVVQVVILLFMGVMAGAASFVHIHDVTVAHGQPSWIGWANAIVIELMSIVAGLDIRRRKRTGQPSGFVVIVLLAAVGVSLAAQVAQAHPSIWGWTVAALPALGLLAVVKIVLSRTTIPAPDRTATSPNSTLGPADRRTSQAPPQHNATTAGNTMAAATIRPDRTAGQAPPASPPDPTADRRTAAEHHPQPIRPARSRPPIQAVAAGPGAGPRQRSGTTPVRTSTRSAPDPDRERPPGPSPHRTGTDLALAESDRLNDVLAIGHEAATNLRHQQIPLTRATLIASIRDAGHTIGTDKATALLRRLRTELTPASQHPTRASQ